MKYYLSSYELGGKTDKLLALVPNGKIGYIPNARDFSYADPIRKQARTKKDMESLAKLGLSVELLDLNEYFGKKDTLRQKILDLGAVFVSGGNVFVLRQAMILSGLDNILKKFKITNDNFLYAGYSAAGCVLSPDLTAYEIVDQPDAPYPQQQEIIWTGLNHFDWYFMPHWDSDHPESELIAKEIAYCEKNSLEYKALRDGEVYILDK